MSGYDPRSWLDRAIGACFGILLAAIAVHWAARLIEQVWLTLAMVLGVVLGVGVAATVIRARSRGW